MQERMLMLGHFPELMPDKRPTQDDLTMQAKVALDETRERRTFQTLNLSYTLGELS